MAKTFKQELEELINKHSVENGSDTPDFILADYMAKCLVAYNHTIEARDKWYGFKPWQSGIAAPPLKEERTDV